MSDLTEWREELAGVIGQHAPTVDTFGEPRAAGCSAGCEFEATESNPYRMHLADAVLASPAMARLFAEVRAEAWDDGVRQAVSWLQADYPYGDMPDWRQSGVDWLLDRRLEHRTATNAHPTDDHAWEAK